MSRQSHHGEQCMNHVCVCDSRNTRLAHKFSLLLTFPVISFLFSLWRGVQKGRGIYVQALIA